MQEGKFDLKNIKFEKKHAILNSFNKKMKI
jgi:hypothetical protein